MRANGRAASANILPSMARFYFLLGRADEALNILLREVNRDVKNSKMVSEEQNLVFCLVTVMTKKDVV